MGNNEFEQPQDDFEVEITNLDEPAADAGSSWPDQPRRRFSPRQRRLHLIIINGVLILAMIIILASTAPVRGLVGSVFFHPTPTPTPIPLANWWEQN